MLNRDFDRLVMYGGLEGRVFAARGGEKGLSPALVLKLAYYKNRLQPIIDAFIKAKKSLLEPYFLLKDGNKVMDPRGNWIIDPEKQHDLQKALDEFLDQEIDPEIKLPSPISIPEEELNKIIKNDQLSGSDLAAVMPFIIFPEEK